MRRRKNVGPAEDAGWVERSETHADERHAPEQKGTKLEDVPSCD